jgi:flagellar hook-length control protein FliK
VKTWPGRLPPIIDEAPVDEVKLASAEVGDQPMSAAELAAFLASLPGSITSPSGLPANTPVAPLCSAAPASPPGAQPGPLTAAAGEALQASQASQASQMAAVETAKMNANATLDAPRTRSGLTGRPGARTEGGAQAGTQASAQAESQATTASFAAQLALQGAEGDRSNPTKPYLPPAGIIEPDLIFVALPGPTAPGAGGPNPTSLLPPGPPQDGTPIATGSLGASPGSAEFAPQLGAQLSRFVRDGIHHAKLELNPIEMGPLTVQIRIDGDQAHVHMAAEHSLTRDALELAMPQLASSLRDNGLTLTGGGVSDQPRPSSQDTAPPPRGARINRTDGRQDERSAQERALAEVGALGATSARRRGVVDLLA